VFDSYTDHRPNNDGGHPPDFGDYGSPQYIYFGDFLYTNPGVSDVFVPGGVATPDNVQIISGAWTFNFDSPDPVNGLRGGLSTDRVYIGWIADRRGPASLTLTGPGILRSNGANIGRYSFDPPTAVRITGGETVWDNAALGSYFDMGAATVTVENGASLRTYFARIGDGGGADGELTIDSASFTNEIGFNVASGGHGRLNLINGAVATTGGFGVGTFGATGEVLVAGGSTLDAAGEMIISRGTLDVQNGGHLNVTIGNSFIGGEADGRATISGAGSRWTNSGNLYVRDGSLVVGVGAFVSAPLVAVSENGILKGSGTISGTVINDGVVAPGLSPGILQVDGDFTQNEGGRLELEVGGLTPGVEYDQLLVSGSLSLAGAVELTFVGGFHPSIGDTFDLFRYDEMADVSPTLLIQAPSGFEFAQSAMNGVLSVTVSAVPEPVTLSLLACGIVCLAGGAVRRAARHGRI
jgi:T5SS/PEP-CTERM-associated repeat protein